MHSLTPVSHPPFSRCRTAALALLLFAGAACTRVDVTEHCIETRYGKVVDRQMEEGNNLTVFTDATCFPLTDQNFPRDGEVERMEAQTRDPVTLTGDVAIVYAYDPGTIYDVFRAKRSQAAVEVEVLNAIREGYRNAVAAWSINELFGPRRAVLSDSVRMHIQRKLGNRAVIKQAFVRNLSTPPAIEEQRVIAAKQAQILEQARNQYTIDSVNARAQVLKAEADAKAKELQAKSYASNASLIQLDREKARSEGIARACAGANVQTCVIGVEMFRGTGTP